MSLRTRLQAVLRPATPERKIARYEQGGRVPWSEGYLEYRWRETARALGDAAVLERFKQGRVPAGWGKGLDERVVEYPWIFARLPKEGRMLDAGSTFNFDPIVTHPLIAGRELTVFTLEPERESYLQRRISYVFGDLRQMPFREAWFDVVVCQSTIEHVGMDNTIYGAAESGGGDYLDAARELLRVLRPGGTLLLTFPCGKYEHHGFFQQFDAGMISNLGAALERAGHAVTTYFLYRPEGWTAASAEGCAGAESYNPHTGAGRGNDGAAHCRAVCCIELRKA